LPTFLNYVVSALSTKYQKTLTYTWYNVSTSVGFFNDLDNAFTAGNCDFVSGDGVTVTPSRSLLVNFTCPYVKITWGFLRSNLEPSVLLNDIQSLNNPAVKVGIVNGSVYANSTYTGVTNATFLYYVDSYSAFSAAANQLVHVVLWSQPFAASWLASNNCTNCTYVLNAQAVPQPLALFTSTPVISQTTTTTTTTTTSSASHTSTSSGAAYTCSALFLFLILLFK